MSCLQDPLASVGEWPDNLETGRRCWITANDAQYAQPASPCGLLGRLTRCAKWLANPRGTETGVSRKKRTAHACLDEGGGEACVKPSVAAIRGERRTRPICFELK